MRKLQVIIAAIVSVLILSYCSSQKPIAHNFPPTMLPDVKVAYVKLFDKGKILYDINCAKCHNKKVRGKEIYADFSSAELAQYELRVLNQKHINDLTEQTVTEEELAQIKVFLAYKERTSLVITDTHKEKSASN